MIRIVFTVALLSFGFPAAAESLRTYEPFGSENEKPRVTGRGTPTTLDEEWRRVAPLLEEEREDPELRLKWFRLKFKHGGIMAGVKFRF